MLKTSGNNSMEANQLRSFLTKLKELIMIYQRIKDLQRGETRAIICYSLSQNNLKNFELILVILNQI